MRPLPRLRATLVGIAPDPALRRLRGLRRRGRRARHSVRQRVRPVRVGGMEVAGALRAGGLGRGDGAFVQASLSRFGEIEGGPDAVLEALGSVLGPEGLVAMPAFPLTGGMAEHLRGDPTFDVRHTPSAMGALSERFRQRPGTLRSLHPTHSVCAAGPGAEELVAGHAAAATPFGAGTPFARMVERGMHQVWLGTDVDAFTIYHAFECLLGDRFPLRVLLDEPVDARCVDAAGRERTVPTLVHDPELARRRTGSRSRRVVREELLRRGVMRSVRLGRGEVLVARMPEMLELLDELLRRGVTIYDVEIAGERG